MERRFIKGLTFIETAIAIAAVTVLLALAAPGFESQSVRARVAQGIDAAAAAKSALAETCTAHPRKVLHADDAADFAFEPSEYVEDVVGYANCVQGKMAVGLVMRNTGTEHPPVVALFGVHDAISGTVIWECRTILGEPSHVPSSCRETGIPAGFAPLSQHSG